MPATAATPVSQCHLGGAAYAANSKTCPGLSLQQIYVSRLDQLTRINTEPRHNLLGFSDPIVKGFLF